MKLIIYTSIFLIVSNFAFADVKINKCDNSNNKEKDYYVDNVFKY